MGALFWVLVLVVVAIINFCINRYNSRSYCSYTDVATLRADAKPVSVKQEEVGAKGSKRWRTTILFDDGFKYISHRATVQHNSMSRSRTEYQEILQSAILKHSKIISKKKLKDTP